MTESRPHNIVLAIGGLNGFVSTEVQSSTFVLRISVSAKIPPIANTRPVARHNNENSFNYNISYPDSFL